MSSKEIDKLIDSVLQEKGYEIKTKTESFSMIKLSNYKQTFMELVFVILAAGTSAKLAFKTVNILAKDDFVINASLSQIVSKLKECYRFYNVRGKYIFNSRNYIKDEYDNNFEKIFNLNSTHYKRRNFFSSNTKIQGVGMKAASHFLRNIGFEDYAILDKHIIEIMKENGLISKKFSVLNEKNYIKIEEILREIALKHNISLSTLDLVLWYSKTGKIIK